MKLHSFAVGTAFTIATIVTAHSPALSQQFKNPTHPRLDEIGVFHAQPQATQPQVTVSQSAPQTTSINLSGQTYFSAAPRLVRSASSQNVAYAPSTYEFTLTVPADAGQPLKAVSIAQARNAETIQFDTGRSKAFTGNRYTASSAIPLANIGGSRPASGEVTIAFAQPVQPGSTVTVALEATNPRDGGIYEFGVTAYPEGQNGLGLFLGSARLSFYSLSN